MGLVCGLIGSAAAGYLWTVAFGRALPGLKLGGALDDADSYPGANFAFVAAVLAYLGSAYAAFWHGSDAVDRAAVFRPFFFTALVGAALFVAYVLVDAFV